MAFTTVPTYTTNQLITSSHANTYWRDNINGLFPYTTEGDLAYASAATVLSRLEIGAAGKRLGSDGSVPSWLYGAPLLDADIAYMTSGWTSSTAQAFQDTALAITLSLPVAGRIIAQANFNIRSNGSSSYTAIFRLMIDDEGGPQHNRVGTAYGPASCAFSKDVAAGNRVCKVQIYGYLSNSASIEFGEIIAFACPSA